MDHLSLKDLAGSIYRGNQLARSADPAENKLFEMLYKAFCRRSGGMDHPPFREVDHDRACVQLYNWYADRYRVRFRMPSGTKGQKRLSTCRDNDYPFSLLYSDNRQFKNYLLTSLPQSGSQDLLAFVLHTAVAFMVPLAELDDVLQHLGFHPLHVKNVHHLAIAYVLLMAESKTPDDDFNPFAEVEALYRKAHEILDGPIVPAQEGYRYADLETRIIREDLLLHGSLSSQNFEELVSRNRDDLNMRHSLILADFHKLSAVFIHTFDCVAAPDPDSDQAYSFYQFVSQFCQSSLTRKKYREQLSATAGKQKKRACEEETHSIADVMHPTRNVLILLWLYAYCFSFQPDIYMEDKAVRGIIKHLSHTLPDCDKTVKAFYDKQTNTFDVYGFLTGRAVRDVPQVFRGSDFITFINEKLLNRYGWGPLNEKIPFDGYILKLDPLTLRPATDSVFHAQYHGQKLAPMEIVENVPFPLVGITRLFEHLQSVHIQQAIAHPKLPISHCPLKCSLCEEL